MHSVKLYADQLDNLDLDLMKRRLTLKPTTLGTPFKAEGLRKIALKGAIEAGAAVNSDLKPFKNLADQSDDPPAVQVVRAPRKVKIGTTGSAHPPATFIFGADLGVMLAPIGVGVAASGSAGIYVSTVREFGTWTSSGGGLGIGLTASVSLTGLLGIVFTDPKGMSGPGGAMSLAVGVTPIKPFIDLSIGVQMIFSGPPWSLIGIAVPIGVSAGMGLPVTITIEATNTSVRSLIHW